MIMKVESCLIMPFKNTYQHSNYFKNNIDVLVKTIDSLNSFELEKLKNNLNAF